MEKRQIVNIINFIRAVEPRVEKDLIEPVKEQIKLMKENNLRGTFLVQYDALLMPEYIEILKQLDPNQFELGVWLEIVQPQVEAVGLNWSGRYSWDWHTNCGFSVGYNKENREKLIDVLYNKFKDIFGYYPRVVGSWLFDTHTLRYVCDNYETDAICNCKEQYGTDGYTLWGGYYGQGYYPSRTNNFLPAQTSAQQLCAPMFRMLGSDPVYQFDDGLDLNNSAPKIQRVFTLEPSCKIAGQNKTWVNWYMKENFNGDCLSFGYAQAGQENSFGWACMKDALYYQFKLFAELQEQGKIVCETMGESGRWFKENYKETPASAITAHCAFDDENKKSVWYCSKNYRINLYKDDEGSRIRDLHIFNENYPDPYEDVVCTSNSAKYDTLPVIDGNLFSGNGVLSGGYITYCDSSMPVSTEMTFADEGDGVAKVTFGELEFTLAPDGLKITSKQEFIFKNQIGQKSENLPTVKELNDKYITLCHNGFDYSVKLLKGSFENKTTLKSDRNCLEVSFVE